MCNCNARASVKDNGGTKTLDTPVSIFLSCNSDKSWITSLNVHLDSSFNFRESDQLSELLRKRATRIVSKKKTFRRVTGVKREDFLHATATLTLNENNVVTSTHGIDP